MCHAAMLCVNASTGDHERPTVFQVYICPMPVHFHVLSIKFYGPFDAIVTYLLALLSMLNPYLKSSNEASQKMG